MSDRKAPPAGLQAAGKRLWRSVLDEYELRVDEAAVLESACRTADYIVRLDEALVDADLISRGSMGQDREHPLLAEARQQRALLARLLQQLKLADLEERAGAPGIGNNSVKARAAARARWGVRGA